MYILMSFPRSGNSFIRYCIEILTNYVTVDGKLKNSIKEVLYGEKNTGGDIYKTHDLYTSNPKIINDIKNHKYKMIFIIRNPFEVLNRKENYNIEQYCRMIKDYVSYNNDKIVIYYEDFISNIEGELNKLLKFLDSPTDLQDFINNIEFHRKESLRCYVDKQNNKSYTEGKKEIYHSLNKDTTEIKNYLLNNLNTEQQKIIDRYL